MERRGDESHALVDGEFGHDEQRQCDQELDVYLHVVEERHLHAPEQVPAESRQQQQRQPGEQGQHDDPSSLQFQHVIRKVGAPQELVERPAEHQGEVFVRLRHRARCRSVGHGASSTHTVSLPRGRFLSPGSAVNRVRT
jgi:hypothetical protein